MAHVYNSEFMQYAAESSDRSAGIVTAAIASALKVKSVLDIGCARGTWLRAWAAAGADDIQGVDGNYVDRTTLQIPAHLFTPHELSTPVDLGRKFDLVQSLEVGEHIATSASDTFVANIVRHARNLILFSAAPPGQGGEFHINEQPYDFWRAKFAKAGFVAVDAIRPTIADDATISYWYRYNIMLYVAKDFVRELPPEFAARAVPDSQPIADVSPFAFRLRKAVVARIPGAVQDRIAAFKARLLPTGRF
jgi:SAM-dependent methyltransferase